MGTEKRRLALTPLREQVFRLKRFIVQVTWAKRPVMPTVLERQQHVTVHGMWADEMWIFNLTL